MCFFNYWKFYYNILIKPKISHIQIGFSGTLGQIESVAVRVLGLDSPNCEKNTQNFDSDQYLYQIHFWRRVK